MTYASVNWVAQAAWNNRSGLTLPLTGGEPRWRLITKRVLKSAMRWLARVCEWTKCEQVADELARRSVPAESEAA